MVIYNLMNHLKNFWPDLESNRRGEWEGRAQREREKEKLREWKSSISFRGGVYILPSAKALNSCHRDTHAYTHTYTPLALQENFKLLWLVLVSLKGAFRQLHRAHTDRSMRNEHTAGSQQDRGTLSLFQCVNECVLSWNCCVNIYQGLNGSRTSGLVVVYLLFN